jgi:hypothetical protein
MKHCLLAREVAQMPDNDPVDRMQPTKRAWIAEEMSKRYLHPDAEELLTLVGNPEIIEQHFADRFELEQQMTESGYKLIDWGMVTIGWGKKISRQKENHPTQALIQFPDEPTAVYNIGLGSEGNYTLDQVLNLQTERERVKEVLLFSSRYVNTAISPTVKNFIHEHWHISPEELDH